MATATSKTKTVVKIVEITEQEPDGITLDLRQEEAQALADVLAKVGGPVRGRRGLISEILAALTVSNVRYNSDAGDLELSYAGRSNTIYFKEV